MLRRVKAAFARLDTAGLKVADDVVGWLWRILGVPRIVTLRLLMAAWVLVICTLRFENGLPMGSGDLVSVVLLLLVQTVEEWSTRRFSVRDHNARLLWLRTTVFARAVRLIVTLVVITTSLHTNAPSLVAFAELAGDGFAWGYVQLSYALAPEGPRRRRAPAITRSTAWRPSVL